MFTLVLLRKFLKALTNNDNALAATNHYDHDHDHDYY